MSHFDAIDIDRDGEYRYAVDRGNQMTMHSLSIVRESRGKEAGELSWHFGGHFLQYMSWQQSLTVSQDVH